MRIHSCANVSRKRDRCIVIPINPSLVCRLQVANARDTRIARVGADCSFLLAFSRSLEPSRAVHSQAECFDSTGPIDRVSSNRCELLVQLLVLLDGTRYMVHDTWYTTQIHKVGWSFATDAFHCIAGRRYVYGSKGS